MELDESTFLTSDYTTKLQSKQNRTKQKQKHRPMEQDRKPRNKPIHLWVPGNNLFLTKEARIYNGAKTASSINGAGEKKMDSCM